MGNGNRRALLVIDVQNDFCAGGALAVPDGDAVVPAINRLFGDKRFDLCVLSQDWHPAGHGSFASSHPGQSPFATVQMPYGPQILWPDHCVQGTRGADFHPDLITDHAAMILRKGYHPDIDSYSTFFENDRTTTTGLAGYLRAHDIGALCLVGLATDFCVYYSAIDAVKLGFQVEIRLDCCRGIDLEGSLAAARADMAAHGITFPGAAV